MQGVVHFLSEKSNAWNWEQFVAPEAISLMLSKGGRYADVARKNFRVLEVTDFEDDPGPPATTARHSGRRQRHLTYTVLNKNDLYFSSHGLFKLYEYKSAELRFCPTDPRPDLLGPNDRIHCNVLPGFALLCTNESSTRVLPHPETLVTRKWWPHCQSIPFTWRKRSHYAPDPKNNQNSPRPGHPPAGLPARRNKPTVRRFRELSRLV